MGKIKIITDSNSGIKQKDVNDLDIFVIPMPFYINGQEYFEDISLTTEEFFKFLEQDANISTSQPSTMYLQDLFTNTLKDYDEIVYIPMSSGLSSTCESAKVVAKSFNNKVHVIDNLRISVTQKSSVFEANRLKNLGKSASEIETYLMETKNIASIYIYLDTLKYLKKGGRITPTAALLANLLKIKPILYTRGGKFEKFATCRTIYKAKDIMIEQIKKELEGEFKEYYQQGLMTLHIAHTQNYEEAQNFKKEINEKLPNLKVGYIDPLSLSVSCHIGAGALALAMAIDHTNK